MARRSRIERFDLAPGEVLAGKYVIDDRIGRGWEGEVYRVVERRTRIQRAAKLFYPQRNPKNRTAARYARKLERLRHCPILAQYHHSESLSFGGTTVTCLISELVEGRILARMVKQRSGKRLPAFEGLHLLHGLAQGLECIHESGDYHGDLHWENVLVRRRGVRFQLKLLDFYHRGRPSRWARDMDIIDAIRILYDCLGGARHYASQRPEIKAICCGLKHGLISRRFPTARRLREYLESFEWEE